MQSLALLQASGKKAELRKRLRWRVKLHHVRMRVPLAWNEKVKAGHFGPLLYALVVVFHAVVSVARPKADRMICRSAVRVHLLRLRLGGANGREDLVIQQLDQSTRQPLRHL